LACESGAPRCAICLIKPVEEQEDANESGKATVVGLLSTFALVLGSVEFQSQKPGSGLHQCRKWNRKCLSMLKE
jgi:hypothetical protein